MKELICRSIIAVVLLVIGVGMWLACLYVGGDYLYSLPLLVRFVGVILCLLVSSAFAWSITWVIINAKLS